MVTLVEVQRVVLVESGMVGREVEREEIEFLGLDLGTQRHGESESPEDPDDLVDHLGDRVERAGPLCPARHREVDRTATRAALGFGEFGLACSDRLFEGDLELVELGSCGASFLDGETGERLQGGGELALLAAKDSNLKPSKLRRVE